MSIFSSSLIKIMDPREGAGYLSSKALDKVDKYPAPFWGSITCWLTGNLVHFYFINGVQGFQLTFFHVYCCSYFPELLALIQTCFATKHHSTQANFPTKMSTMKPVGFMQSCCPQCADDIRDDMQMTSMLPDDIGNNIGDDMFMISIQHMSSHQLLWDFTLLMPSACNPHIVHMLSTCHPYTVPSKISILQSPNISLVK